MTPSEKLVRFACEKKYKPILEQLYDAKAATADAVRHEKLCYYDLLTLALQTVDEVTNLVRATLGNNNVAAGTACPSPITQMLLRLVLVGDSLDQVGTDSLTTVKLLNSINLKFGVNLSINNVLEDANSSFNAESLAKMVEASKSSFGSGTLIISTSLAYVTCSFRIIDGCYENQRGV